DAKLPLADARSIRLALGGDVELLFHDGRYGGWILGNALAHLGEPGETPARDAGPELQACLGDYLGLVVQPNVDRMIDEDPAMRAALVALEQRVAALPGAAARFVARAVAGVRETFYPS